MTREPSSEQLPPDEPPTEEQLSMEEWLLKEEEEPPPLGRSWGTLYAVVLVTLAVLVLLFYRFTRAFS